MAEALSLTNSGIDRAVRLDPVTAVAPCTQNCLRVTTITLTARDSGPRSATVTAKIVIRDERQAAVPNTQVTGSWTTPQGVVQASAMTNSAGAAKLTLKGPHGRYQVTVTGAVRSGYTFDPEQSKLLTKSITA